MTASPYENLPPERFWRTGVVDQHPLTIEGLYSKRFDILKSDRIVTAGSCFAQHIAKRLRAQNYSVVDVEPSPPGLSDAEASTRGYGMYSARYGNIYTAAQMAQLVMEAFGRDEPSDRVWEKNGRYYDAQRPNVEPGGFATVNEVLTHRAEHLRQVRRLLTSVDVFIFTFGLTEAWVETSSGTVFPTAPGTIAGVFDPQRYEFRNFTAAEAVRSFARVRSFLMRHNPGIRFLVTVSPVPLTATGTSVHVLQATTYSKSALRAACGELYAAYDNVDYFPSYEMIASPFSKGFFFEPNMRSVAKAGVDAVMRVFFSEHASEAAATPESAPAPRVRKGRRAKAESTPASADEAPPGKRPRRQPSAPLSTPDAAQSAKPSSKGEDAPSSEDVVCEEAMLDAFAR